MILLVMKNFFLILFYEISINIYIYLIIFKNIRNKKNFNKYRKIQNFIFMFNKMKRKI